MGAAGGAGGGGGEGGAEPLRPSLELLGPGLAIDLTPDGSIALVQDLASSEGDLHFYDVATGTLELQTSLGDALKNLATGISQTGRLTALHAVPVQASFFEKARGWVDLESPFPTGCDQDLGGAWDISADGAVVVGFAWNVCSPQAFRWSDDGGDGTLLLLDLLGASAGPNPPVNLGKVPNALPNDPCYPNAMTADGSRIFGGCGNPFFGVPVAFVWTEADGMRPLVDIVTESGLTVPVGFTLTSVLATSTDGSVVLGVAVDELMNQKSFVLVLPTTAS